MLLLAGPASDLVCSDDTLRRIVLGGEEVPGLALGALRGVLAVEALLAEVELAALTNVLLIGEPEVEASLMIKCFESDYDGSSSQDDGKESENVDELAIH